MSMDDPIVIDLKQFGGEGYVEVMERPLSRIRATENLVASKLLKTDKSGNVVKDLTANIDAVYIQALSYIESAPFKTDLDSFFAYTDALDAKKRGMGQRLFNAIKDAAEKVAAGETSPSADSPAAESGSSA